MKNCAVFITNPPLWLQSFTIVASVFYVLAGGAIV